MNNLEHEILQDHQAELEPENQDLQVKFKDYYQTYFTDKSYKIDLYSTIIKSNL